MLTIPKGVNSLPEPSDPSFGAYYMTCNSNNIAVYNVSNKISSSTSFMFWFRPSSGPSSVQTLVVISNNDPENWTFAVEYLSTAQSIRLRQQSPSATFSSAPNLILSGNKIYILSAFSTFFPD